MSQCCRSCGAPLRACQVIAEGGGGVFLSPSPPVRAALDAEEDFDYGSLRWICRYLDGYPCFDCGTVDLMVVDLPLLLVGEDPEWGICDRNCRACGRPCREPRYLETEGAPGMLLAFLEPKYGAPLWSHLCASCGRIWLGLDAGDALARTELAEQFPDAGRCECCGRGQLRVTRIDAPYCGQVGLWEAPGGGTPGMADGGGGQRVAWLLIAVCDYCGAAETRWEITSVAAGGRCLGYD